MHTNARSGENKDNVESFDSRRSPATEPTSFNADLIGDVVNSMEQGVIVWDREAVCELHNERMFTVLELKASDLYVGLTRSDFLQMGVERGEFEQQVADQAQIKFEKGEPFSFERTMPSGRRIFTSVRPRDCGGFVVSFSDVTILKENELELAKAKDRAEAAETELSKRLDSLKLEKAALERQQTLLTRLSLVATHAKDIVAITSSDGTIEWVNEAFTAALGYEPEEITGSLLLDNLCGEQTDPASLQLLKDHIQQRHIVSTELVCYCKHMNPFWMEIEVTPVFSQSGEHTNFIAVGRDTTVRKTAELNADKARKFERRKRIEARLLAEFNGWLQSTDSLAELFPVVSAFLKKLLPTSSGAVYVYANSRDVLDGVCEWNNNKMLTNFEPPDCWALRRGRSYYYGENDVDFLCQHVIESYGEKTPARHYCLPIIAHGDTVGLLCIELPASSDEDSAQETQKLANFCGEQISLAIANVQLREQLQDQSTRDSLTSLYNRRYFFECVRRELNRANGNAVASLISLDVDNFKRFNDNYGHDAGDAILRELSTILIDTFRDTDIPCRFGGEEFAVFLPDASAEIALQRAEELRAAVENTSVLYSGEKLKITISSGVATMPENGTNIQSIMKSADRALYVAKDAGRNNVKHIDDVNRRVVIFVCVVY